MSVLATCIIGKEFGTSQWMISFRSPYMMNAMVIPCESNMPPYVGHELDRNDIESLAKYFNKLLAEYDSIEEVEHA